MAIATSKFEDRNGEHEPPTINGAWYWYFSNSASGVLFVMDDEASDTFNEWKMLCELDGRWWGPVDSPWNDEDEIEHAAYVYGYA